MDVGPVPDQGQHAHGAGPLGSGGSCSAGTASTASGVAGDAACAQRLRGQQGADHRATIVPPCPAVALYGRAIIKSLVAGWWG
eukprot:6206348-Lingulodinium_polyedra.AAC.1